MLAHYRRKLRAFQRIPPSRREAECADEGEATCRAMIAELAKEMNKPAPPARLIVVMAFEDDGEGNMRPAFDPRE
ncbi:hypothetical protein V6617_01585 [Pelagibacterium nitratireducens]|uniref:Uncharacterized protein n=1 Tax=Pelagibacterium nitratireducens TaxID=1046114 RepID=A0ABZ2I4P9_9HYPH